MTTLSYTKLSRFEQCPKSYELHYIRRLPSEPGIPLRFGSAIHATLERLVEEAVAAEKHGPLDRDRATALWRDAWNEAGLSGLELFEEGFAIIKAFVRAEGVFDPWKVLAVEKGFELPVGRFSVLGFIDRVNRVDDETIEVLDYKTNRQLFSRDEVDGSLQLSIYALAARQLWPWARRIRLAFVMLRHGVRMVAERTPEQLDAARAYIEALGDGLDGATEFPPRLNANCCYCDHRRDCPAYAAALTGERGVVCEDPTDLEAVAREREEVARLAKILYTRKDELDRVLRARLRDRDELVLGGVRYRMLGTSRLDYPLGPALRVLEGTTGLSREGLLDRIAVVDKHALDKLVAELGKTLDDSKAGLLKLELDAIAERHVTPRFLATPASPAR